MDVWTVLRCPRHPNGPPLGTPAGMALYCPLCRHAYQVWDGIPDLVVPQEPQQSYLEAEARQWDEQAWRYEEERDRDSVYMAGIQAAAQALAVQAPELILDAGCGTGLTIRQYVQPGLRVVGFDLSLNSLRQIQRTALAETVGLVRGDLANLPFADATFDKVLCANTLQHVPTLEQRRRCIGELARVARPEARVVVTAHNFSSSKKHGGWRKEGSASSPSGSVQYIYRYEAAEFRTLLATALVVDRVFGAGFPLPYRFKLSPLSCTLERLLRRLPMNECWGNLLVGVCHRSSAQASSAALARLPSGYRPSATT